MTTDDQSLETPAETPEASVPELGAATGSTVLLRCYWRDYRRNVILTAPLVVALLAATYHVEDKGIAILAGAAVGLWLGAAHSLAWALAQRRLNQSNTQAQMRHD